MDVTALIARARENFDQVKPVDQEVVLLGGEVVMLRFWPLTGTAYSELGRKHTGENGFPDVHKIAEHYPRVYIVDGGDVTHVEDFPALWAVITAPYQEAVMYAVWGLNEQDAREAAASAGKASKGGRRKKPTSPASSASQSGN